MSAQYVLCGDINWLLVNTGVVAGASDPEVLDKVFGNVKETQKVYSQSVAVLGQDRLERLEEKMKDDERKKIFAKKSNR